MPQPGTVGTQLILQRLRIANITQKVFKNSHGAVFVSSNQQAGLQHHLQQPDGF